ncbi:hypothetical protein [Pseudoxanthomonas indica]|uniref:Extracellular repeat, HAF family n=1 Tax=Pseudoxanthomonas indica TaxID=428993 RepID=A0A1T5LDH3_9GAMM|nr:hypothetical protein [Pseudoxanthomonas indica]SKC73745.1 hypothetical protein SAMN06296058_2310 [Pseudoxanthomonas indica]
MRTIFSAVASAWPLSLLALAAIPCAAASLSEVGQGSGAQCVTAGVNNSGTVVGSCSPASVGGAMTAWMTTSANVETTLLPLATGQHCTTGGIANSGSIIGMCRTSSNARFAVVWHSAAPTSAPLRLLPLQGLLGLLADVRTFPTAFNQTGAVAGSSVSASGDTSAVVWLAGDDTALLASTRGDNCNVSDLSESTVAGRPAVAMNCPNASATLTAKVAQATGLLNAYVATSLPLPGGANYCTVKAINSSLQVLGTCHYPAPDLPRVSFWSSPGATPTVLSNGARSHAVALNNLGRAVLVFQDAQGNEESAFWNPATNTFTVIPPLPGGVRSEVVDIADNDFVILNSDNDDQDNEGAFWRAAVGTSSVGFFDDGFESGLVAVSSNGQYAVGAALDGDDNETGVVTPLP